MTRTTQSSNGSTNATTLPLDRAKRLASTLLSEGGEASGAGVAILLARAGLACHSGMATFAEAGVSGADD